MPNLDASNIFSAWSARQSTVAVPTCYRNSSPRTACDQYCGTQRQNDDRHQLPADPGPSAPERPARLAQNAVTATLPIRSAMLMGKRRSADVIAQSLQGSSPTLSRTCEAKTLSDVHCTLFFFSSTCRSINSPGPLSLDLTSSVIACSSGEAVTALFRGPSVCAIAAPPIPAVNATRSCGCDPPTSTSLYFFPGSSPLAAICRLSISPRELIDTLACAAESAPVGGTNSS